ncbi:hypothetical protein [Actinomadura sp. 3N407]|uniref:hypothetical protein n=1 Tax=Actinomadura sp. 3N407 TaxID=3457423 RepID=UPI003FCC2ED1
MSKKPDDPIEQMWVHLDEMGEIVDDLRKAYGDRAAEPLLALSVRMGDTLTDIQQGTDT